ncbi:MAG: hypothetical protein H0X30_32530 [Anaerolineae bacterium]|nr:hypothetical protein [Anaerolineae bacterium]
MDEKAIARNVIARLSPDYELSKRLDVFLATEPKDSAKYKRVCELLELARSRKAAAERAKS